MRKRDLVFSIIVFAVVPLSITVGFYFVNVLLFSSHQSFSATDALFVEGIMCLLIGVLLLLGRGGMNSASLRAAILSATAEAVSDLDTVGPAEQMRLDSWKSKGFIRAGLVLIITAVIMIIAYFLFL